jgi:hypothetical protein
MLWRDEFPAEELIFLPGRWLKARMSTMIVAAQHNRSTPSVCISFHPAKHTGALRGVALGY